MKWTIICVKDNKCIGYWFDGKIRTKSISLYDDRKELERDFYHCSLYIPTYVDESIIPIVMIVSINSGEAKASEWANLHLEHCKTNWPHLPERIKVIEKAIENIKVLKS